MNLSEVLIRPVRKREDEIALALKLDRPFIVGIIKY